MAKITGSTDSPMPCNRRPAMNHSMPGAARRPHGWMLAVENEKPCENGMKHTMMKPTSDHFMISCWEPSGSHVFQILGWKSEKKHMEQPKTLKNE